MKSKKHLIISTLAMLPLTSKVYIYASDNVAYMGRMKFAFGIAIAYLLMFLCLGVAIKIKKDIEEDKEKKKKEQKEEELKPWQKPNPYLDFPLGIFDKKER